MKKLRLQDITQFLISVGILFAIGFLGTLLYTKFDLTAEKRHTLTPATKEILGGLEDKVFIKVYLSGDFPARYKRLEQAIRERLDEFRDYSDNQIEYEFIDPYTSDDDDVVAETEEILYKAGLQFSRISYEEGGVKSFRLIWPAALITYNGRDIPVQFLKSDNPEMQEGMINASINNIEYELTGKLSLALTDKKPTVAFLQGHGELEELETYDIRTSLSEFYTVEEVRIDGKLNALTEKLDNMKSRITKYDALVIAKPDSSFSNQEKLILDQYIMAGGKVLWLVDPILTDLDSLRTRQQTIGLTNEIGIYDMLFDYGVRLNRNMVIDRSCALISFDTGPMGNQRNMQMFNWYFSPVVIPPDTAHPIVSNLDPILFQFCSSLEPVGDNPKVEKTVLLTSSYYSRELKAPVRVNSAIVNIDPNFKELNKPNQPLAVLLEGEFLSNFRDRLPDTLLKSKSFAFRGESKPTKMIVIADGDVIANSVVETADQRMPRPLGYDRYANRVIYDNKEFILNAINYLLNDNALISIRSRNIELRKLDPERIVQERTRWQVINMLVPIVLVLLFAFVQLYLRKRKYSS